MAESPAHIKLMTEQEKWDYLNLRPSLNDASNIFKLEQPLEPP